MRIRTKNFIGAPAVSSVELTPREKPLHLKDISALKTASPSLSVAAAVVAAACFAVTAVAQAPQTQPSGPPPGGAMGAPHREFHIPPPKNLQVLPKDLTGEQVHHIMEGWARSLGTHCDTCHAPDPKAVVAAGHRPRLDFPLDIKPDKSTARLMYKMVQDINTNYIAMVKDSGDTAEAQSSEEAHADEKVSCATCHRGHLKPPAFVPPPEHREGPPPGAPGSGPAPRPSAGQ